MSDNDNVLFKKLRKLINLIDQLRDCGVQDYIKLPRIASLGTQSSGKSSVLESIVGLDFLPRGDGVVTRRPLELRLCHIISGEPWAIFEEKKGVKFTDFNKVRETIESLTDDVCVGEKNIVDKPIVLNVFSQTCPDLTLVDLPGVTRVPVGKQPKNIEEITKNMAARYCNDPLTIILCVIAANSDIATSDGLKMAKELDVNGVRTLGVLTKLDIMDSGTDAKRAMMGEEIPLKLGYVGVKNRSKLDLINKIPMQLAFKQEKDYFMSHPIYKRMPSGYWGTDVLIQKLTKVLFKVIREHLPTIIRGINDNIKKCEDELSMLGQPMPTDDAGKMNMLWTMLNEYCDVFKNVLRGKYDSKRLAFLKDEGGYKIKAIFKSLLEEFTGDYKATAHHTDESIKYAITMHEGDSIPGFPSVDAFYFLLKPELEKIKEPINESFSNICQYLEMLSDKILERTFIRFPRIIDDISDFVNVFINKEKENAKQLVDCIVDMEINFLFTNDLDYMTNYTSFLPKQEKNQAPVDERNVLVREIRNRIEAYFKLIVRNLRDSIPKAIGYYLVQSIEDNMQMALYNALYKDKDMVTLLNEPEEIMRTRLELTRQIKVMREAQKIIKRDPDLMSVMQININDSDITSSNISEGRNSELYDRKSQPDSTNQEVKQSSVHNTNNQKQQPKQTAPGPGAGAKKSDFKNLFG